MLFQILQNVTKIYKKSMDNSKDSSGTATFYFGTVGSLTSMKLNRCIHSTNSWIYLFIHISIFPIHRLILTD